MRRRTVLIAGIALGAGSGLAYAQPTWLEAALNYAGARMRRSRTLDEVMAEFGPAARSRLLDAFADAGAGYPPPLVTLIGLKAEHRLEVWVPGPAGRPIPVADYAVVAASGGPGPKLREGDRQVPEGIYPITFLNANSRFHLSLRVGYPSADDRARAAEDGRTDLGGDIMIHGAGGSIGCVALSNAAIEEVFVLAADVGISAVQVILAPHDLRGRPVPPVPDGMPAWTADRYQVLHQAMADFVTAAD